MNSEAVLVIGGTRGTGLLAVRLLASRGMRVRVLARDAARAAERLGPSVEVVPGDITKAGTLVAAVSGALHIIFTAGIRSGRFAREAAVKAADYQGVLNTLAAARAAGFRGRFVYMTSIGVNTPSLASRLLNLYKRNTLVWRRRVESEIRSSGLDYAIVRAGFLTDAPGGQRALQLTQDDLPLVPRYRIPRADVAEVLIDALYHPAAARATFDAISGSGPRQESVRALMNELQPDREDTAQVADWTARPFMVERPADVLALLTGAARCVVLREEQLSADFYDLSTGFAGEVVQKCANYGIRVAVIGSHEQGRSTHFREFARESNRRDQFLFVASMEEARRRLTRQE